jgi:spermidine synthase/tetratricopeptide (TPR) repeat protein
MVIGSSVYSFTIILLAFLVGIAIGSAVMSSMMHRIRNPVLVLAFCKLYVGLMAVMNFLVMDDLPFWFARLVVRNMESYHEHIGTVQFFMFCIAALAIIPVTIGMGAGFPLTIKIATSGHDRVGRDVGNIYAINTVGCIIGSFGSAFIFVPGLSMLAYQYVSDFHHGFGLQYAVYLSLFMNFAMAFSLVLVSPKRPELNPIKYVLAPLIPAWYAVVLLFVPQWNLAHMTLGNFRLSVGRSATDPDQVGSPNMEFYFDGMSTTVSVERWGRHLALKNNGKVDASNGEDMSTQIMVAGFPLVFHPEGPEGLDLAVIGFGSGTTLGSASQFPVNRIDIIELEPSISGPRSERHWTRAEWERASEAERQPFLDTVEFRRERAGARFFREINHDPWSVPWVNVINNDGRNYLASTTRRYDVVISEPSNPWITGVSDLFTIDHFHTASQALAPGGIFCQWVQLYELSPENIQAVFRAIAAVYPYMIVFAAEDLSSDTVILASYDPIPFDLARVEAAMSTTVRDGETTVRTELARAGVHEPFDVFARVIFASREEVLAYSSQPTVGGRRCAVGHEDQSRMHLEPIDHHNRGVCIGPDGVGGEGQCDTDADCRGDGVRCLVGPMMGVCQDGQTVCTEDAQCRGTGEEAVDAQCQICAVELNTDDNSRIEFNAPRDLIGFEAHENTVSRFYSPEWPYGRLCRDPSRPEACLLRNMGEGVEAAARFADLGLSLLGAGKVDEARRFIEHSATLGRNDRSNLAAEVYQLLLDDSREPPPTFGRPEPPASVSEETRRAIATLYDQVTQSIEGQQWQQALGSFERLPSGMLQAAGPDLAYMAAYVLYRNATASPQQDPRFSREAGRILHDVERLDEQYLRDHPDILYYLGRCYVLENAFNEARRYMTRFVELRAGAAPTDEERPEAGVTNGDGVSDKDVHPAADRSVPLTEEAPEPPAPASASAPRPAEPAADPVAAE